MHIKHIKYVDKTEATGRLRGIYDHIKLNFGQLAEPFVLHSLNEELTAGVWATLYETVLIENNVKRSIKETVATCISEVNKCNYCADAHSIMILGTENKLQHNIKFAKSGKLKTKEDKLIFWALNNLNFDHHIILAPPFNKSEIPETIGTAVLFHYINRMVNIFASDTPLPTSKLKSLVKYFASNFIFKKAIKKKKVKGDSLKFIDISENSGSFEWANEIPEIQNAFKYLKFYTEINIKKVLSFELITELVKQASNLNLLRPTFGNKGLSDFLEHIKPAEKQIAEFSFLTMFETYKIQEKHINALKQTLTDKNILEIASYVSLLVSESIGNKLYENCEY